MRHGYAALNNAAVTNHSELQDVNHINASTVLGGSILTHGPSALTQSSVSSNISIMPRLPPISKQFQNIQIVLWDSHSRLYHVLRDIPKAIISIVCLTLAMVSPSIDIVFISTLGWICMILWAIYEINAQIMHASLVFTFSIYYKVISAAVGMLAVFIVFDWYEDIYDDTNSHHRPQMFYIFGITVIFGNMLVVLLGSLHDGWHVSLVLKIIYYVTIIFFYCDQSVKLLFGSTFKGKSIHFHTNFQLAWKSIGTSSLGNVIIFLTIQIINIIRKPNKLSVIDCYVPIYPVSITKLNNYDAINVNQSNVNKINSIFDKNIKLDHDLRSNIDSTTINSNCNDSHSTGLFRLETPMRSSLQSGGFVIVDSSKLTKKQRLTFEIRNQSRRYEITVYENRTIWFCLFKNICCFKDEKCLQYSMFLSNKYVLIMGCFMISINAILQLSFVKRQWMYFSWISVVWSIITTIFTIIVVFNLNIDLFLFEMKHNFSIYWRIYDLIAIITATIMIDKNYSWFEFKNNRFNHFQSQIIITIILEYLDLILIGIAICNIKAFLNIVIPFKFQIIILSMYILWCIQNALYYCFCLDNDNITFSINLPLSNQMYEIDLKDVLFVRTIDVAIWFGWQLVEHVMYPNQLRLSKVTRMWKHKDVQARFTFTYN